MVHEPEVVNWMTVLRHHVAVHLIVLVTEISALACLGLKVGASVEVGVWIEVEGDFNPVVVGRSVTSVVIVPSSMVVLARRFLPLLLFLLEESVLIVHPKGPASFLKANDQATVVGHLLLNNRA